VQGAVTAIKELSDDPTVRHQALVEEMARRDWISWTDYTKREGIEQGEYTKARSIAKNLIQIELPLEQIITATGLTRDEIEGLYK
jgi:predicted transposase/invertase (TIGR01784 family)